jgi:hypothetical protein
VIHLSDVVKPVVSIFVNSVIEAIRLLAGPPKPDRSMGRGQTKSSSLALQVRGCAIGLVTHPQKV